MILLAPAAPGFNVSFTPVLYVSGGDAEVADISVWSTGCGNSGAALLTWNGSPASGLWDFNILASATVWAKAIITGTGYFSNTWLAASTAYDPLESVRGTRRRSRPADLRTLQAPLLAAAARAVPATGAMPFLPTTMTHAADAHTSVSMWREQYARQFLPIVDGVMRRSRALNDTCLFTPIGELVAASDAGPLFWVGANLEHAIDGELLLLPGASNVVVVTLETEESDIGLSINETSNTVIFGALHAFWNASERVTAEIVLAQRAGVSSSFDLTYRIIGFGVPLPASEAALALDVSPDGRGFAVPLNSLPTGFARAAALLLAPTTTSTTRDTIDAGSYKGIRGIRNEVGTIPVYQRQSSIRPHHTPQAAS